MGSTVTKKVVGVFVRFLCAASANATLANNLVGEHERSECVVTERIAIQQDA
jgi:hypothetical protein